jgi:hypothetical protein
VNYDLEMLYPECERKVPTVPAHKFAI